MVVLADNARELVRHPGLRDRSSIDRVFVWHGDAKILLTIVKLVEDQLNVEHGGQKFGMIKFGSTTELILPRPDDVEVLVAEGDKVRAGHWLCGQVSRITP